MPEFTLQYVYSPGDFDPAFDSVPDEHGQQAAGSPPWHLRLTPGASPQRLTITDDDPIFEEIGDSNQILASPITIDGVTYPAGSTVIINYVITTVSGFEGYSITIGSPNTGNNFTTAFVTNGRMVPGQVYIFVTEENIGTSNTRNYEEFVCFGHDTRIGTPNGEDRVIDLHIGDKVLTLDHEAQSVRWLGRRTVPGVGSLAPVVISAGTLGTTRDLTLSQNHKVLLSGPGPQLVLGVDEALVSVKMLADDKAIRIRPTGFVTYVHIMFDRHEILWANGCLVESLRIGVQAIGGLEPEQMAELEEIFPGISHSRLPSFPPARAVARSFEGRVMADYLTSRSHFQPVPERV